MEESDKRGAVVGIGNVLCSDDGIGVTVLKYLENRYRFPETVELVDGGTSGAALQNAITGKDWILVIDALAVAGAPGEVRLLSESDFASLDPDLKLSPHQISFFDMIQLMNFIGTERLDWSVIGVIPETTVIGTSISDAVAKSVETVAETLIDQLNLKGIFPEPVGEENAPDYWWTA